jgi:hypothetical protein
VASFRDFPGKPLTDPDELMTFDRHTLASHRVDEFVRPQCEADKPLGHINFGPRIIPNLEGSNAVHVAQVRPGVRIRTGHQLPRGFNLEADGWIVMYDECA